MINIFCRLRILCVVPLMILSVPSLAQTVYSYHASMCQGAGAGHEAKMKVTKLGVENKHATSAIWIRCPVPVEYFDSSFTDSGFGVVVTNSRNTSVKIYCILDALDPTGFTSRSSNITVAPNNVKEQVWEIPNKELVGALISCKLPPKTGLGLYIGGSTSF
jgi:hypothetical protein